MNTPNSHGGMTEPPPDSPARPAARRRMSWNWRFRSTDPSVVDAPAGASIGLAAVMVRGLAIVAANELIAMSLGERLRLTSPLLEAAFRLAVTLVVAPPLLYLLVVRPLIRNRRIHAALERTVQAQRAALAASEDASALSSFAETVIDTVPVGLAVLSADLRVQSTNRVMRELFVLSEREMDNMPVERILPGVKSWRLVAEVLGSDQPSPTVAVDAPDANGPRHFQLTLARLRQGEALRLLLVVEDITARVRTQEQADSARARFEGILDAASDAIVCVDEAHRIIVFNQQAERVFGYLEREAVGQPVSLLLPLGAQDAHDAKMRGFAGEGAPRRQMGERSTLAGRRKDGEEFPVEITISRLSLAGATVLTAIVRDVTERERAARELRESRESLADFLESASDLVQSVTADGRFAYVNRAWREAFGYGPDEVAALTMFDVIHPDHREYGRDLWRRILVGESVRNVETVFIHKNGRAIHVEGSVNGRTKDGVFAARAIFRDVTERKQAADRLHHLAYYDTLTGLPNRVLFHDHLTKLLAQARRTNHSVALLYVDLDRFKEVNDTLGHEAGDQLLKIVAQRLRGVAREGDAVCRLGGDEFAVVAGMTRPQGAESMTRKLIKALAHPITLEGREVSVTPSIGIAIAPGDGEDFHRLLKNADTAMYRAKTRRNAYQFYEESMHARALDRLDLESRLRRALERNEFVAFYEPQVDMASGRLTGFEALAWWRQPDGTLRFPGEFIPVAEDTGLIVPLGEWALKTVCAQLRAWRAAGLDPVRVAVNVSSRQLMQSGFPNVVERALRASGVEPSCLQLELTEHLFTRDTTLIAATLRGFRDMGVTMAIDDFGAGYSSLGYLKRFPIETLKIGIEFIRDVIGSPDDAAIVTAIVAMAHGLGMRVVAEGVERRAQWEWLRAHGVDVAQGSLIARAMPAEGATQLLHPSWRFGLPEAA